MSTVIADISTSVDGYVTGPDPGPRAGLGVGGEPVHAWVHSTAEADQRALDRAAEASAVVMGRRLFDVVDGPHGWTDNMGYGADRDARPPLFVLTHEPPAHPRLAASYDVTFVCEGPAAAVEQAARAGAGEVYVMGGAATVVGCLGAGVVDRLRLHVSPVLLGGGTRLFDGPLRRHTLRQLDVAVSPVAVHVTYEVQR